MICDRGILSAAFGLTHALAHPLRLLPKVKRLPPTSPARLPGEPFAFKESS